MTGELWFHFASAILMTAVVSSVVVTWYRRAVVRSMGVAGDAPTEVDPRFEQALPAPWPGVPVAPRSREDSATSAERQLRRRAIVAYGLGGLAASTVMTALFLVALGEAQPLQIFTLLYAFCWPIVPTLSFLLGLSRTRTLVAFAAYIGIGALMILILSLAAGRGLLSLQNTTAFLQFLAVKASIPLLIILFTSGTRIRSVAPLVLAGLLVFSFSNLAAGSALIVALDSAAIRNALLTLGAFGGYNAWYLLAALPIGYACWQGLRWLGRRYERKVFSDGQLLIDAWWLIVTFDFGIFLVTDMGWIGLPLGLLAFVAYRMVVAGGLTLWRSSSDAWLSNRRLLLLRVFGFQRRTERLFDTVAQRWRWLGSVKIIAGADLATRLIGPGDLISFMAGRLRQLFLQRDRTSFRRLAELDEARDPDGRYRVNKVYCHQDSWQPALQGLLAATDVVLMDLRGFSEKNQGCLFELQQLVAQDRVQRTVFIVDDTTDTKLLEAVLSIATPLNLVAAKSGLGADAGKVYRALAALH